MSTIRTRPAARSFLRPDPTTDAVEEADNTTLQRVDDAELHAKPDAVTATWKELEYDERSAEQTDLHAAEGSALSRPAVIEAAGLIPQADAAAHLTNQQKALVDHALRKLTQTIDALSPFRTRGPKAKPFYYARTAGFLIGDIAGISGAAISLGEVPANAYILAIAAATATVVAGLVGKDVKVVRESLRRKRDPDTLTPEQQPFAHLFHGKDLGWGLIRGSMLASGAIGILVAAGIFALRASIEGTLSGLVYGAFAAAVALGSAASSFAYGDEISDQIDNAAADYDRELKRHLSLSGLAPWKRQLEKTAEAESIVTETADRGRAASTAVTGHKYRILARNPGTVGHGPTTPSDTIGRRAREKGTTK